MIIDAFFIDDKVPPARNYQNCNYSMHLKNAVCIVTGGASGIGLAFTKKALASGAHVIIADLASPKESVVSDSDSHLDDLSTVLCLGHIYPLIHVM